MEETQETREADYAAEKMAPKRDVGKREDVFEQLPHEEVVAPPGRTEYEEEMSQRDQTSQLKGRISVADSAKKETKMSKQKLVPKTQEATVVREDKPALPEKPPKERKEELMVIPERREDLLHEGKILIKKQRPIGLKEKGVREQGLVKAQDRDKDKGSVEVKISTDEPKPPMIISTDASGDERRALTEKSVKRDDQVTSTAPTEKDRRLEQVTETIKEAEKVPAKDGPVEAAPSQMRRVTEDTRRVVETQIQPAVITESRRETLLEDLSFIKPEAAQDLKSDVTFKKKGVSKVGESREEKVIQGEPDTELKRPKVIQQDPAGFSTKAEGPPRKGEKGRFRPPQEESVLVAETKPTVSLKSAERKRPSPPTAARGIKRLSNHYTFHSLVHPKTLVYVLCLIPNHLHRPSLFCYCGFFPNELFFVLFFLP